MADKVTGNDLWNFCEELVSKKAGYVWGARGKVYDEAERDYLYNHYRTSRYDRKYYYITQWARWKDHIVVDCSGMIQAFRIAKLDGKDSTANGLYQSCTTKGTISTLPKTKRGILLFTKARSSSTMVHVGVYGGNNETIESQNSEVGVVKRLLTDGGWTHWGIVPWCTPVEVTPVTHPLIRKAKIIGGYTVTAYALNVRKGPSSKKHDVIRTLKKGDKVAVYEYAALGSWARIHPYKDEWVSCGFLAKLDMYRVIASALTIRKGSGMFMPAAGYFHKNDIVFNFGKAGIWMKVDPVNNYWSSSSFMRKI